MHICVLLPTLDLLKGGNHLPLFAALPEVTFTVLCNSARPANAELPPNIRVITLNEKIGPYYYGVADTLFARAVLRWYPATDSFWHDFDLLHVNQALGSGLLQLKKTGKPFLYVVHHPVTADREVAVAESGFFAAMRWRLRYAPLVSMQRTLCRNADRIMTVSHTVAARLASEYGCDPAKITVVPNGIDGERFVPKEGEPTFDVIATGSFFHPRKGFPYLAKAYRALAAEGVRIADVGKRSGDQRKVLASIPGVTQFGPVDDDRLLSLLQSSSCLISTALYEGFGLSIIEALACGKPAFAFGGGAVPEVLGGIDPHLVVPMRDTDALATCVRDFLALSDAARLEQGRRYREDVLARYSLRNAASMLRRLYESLNMGKSSTRGSADALQ